MHTIFSTAVFRRPIHRAFGLDLQPLTLGHLFLLREYRCKLLSAPKESQFGDVLLAVFICSTSHQKARRHLQSAWRLDRFIGKWARNARRLNLEEEIGKFFAYFHECRDCPSIKGDHGEAKSPEEWRIQAMLMADFHVPREETFDFEVAAATALWLANGDRTGKLEIEDFDASTAAWEHQHKLDLEAARAKEVSCSA